MITKHTYTLTYEQAGQRIRDEVTQWRLFDTLPLSTQRREVWRKAAAISDDLRSAVLEADKYQCIYCGSTDYPLLSIDHVIPQIQGGCSTAENLRTACQRCNSIKNGRTPEEAGMPLAWGRYIHKNTPDLTSQVNMVLHCKAKGISKEETIKRVYGVTKGGNPAYKQASSWYDQVIDSVRP